MYLYLDKTERIFLYCSYFYKAFLKFDCFIHQLKLADGENDIVRLIYTYLRQINKNSMILCKKRWTQ